MEGISRSKLILEFNGLPGAGKSTISTELQALLTNNGISSIRSYYSKQSHRNNKSLFLSLRWCHALICLFLLSKKVHPKNDRRPGVIAFVKYLRMYTDYLMSSCDSVLIADEGLVQAITSFFHIDTISSNKVLGRFIGYIKKSNIEFIRVDCQNDINRVYLRIKGRGTTGARLDVMDGQALFEALEIQSNNLTTIRNSFSDSLHQRVIRLDTNLSPSINANYIFSQVSRLISSNEV